MIATRVITKDDYHAFVERVEARFEFDGKNIVALHSGIPVDESLIAYVLSDDFEAKNLPSFPMPTKIHDIIVSNITAILSIFLKCRPYRAYCQGTNLRVIQEETEEEEQNKSRVPDIMVVEKNMEIRNAKHEVINPVVLIEVLSKSTQKIDKTEKLEEYQALESLQEYIMIAQDQPRVVIYRKITEKKWEEEIFDS
ncbi:MAG: Uma2 family endonuclease, partial [Verrucomicrobia bacterium]|nr:Uma2 family endonuclease [Cytophagales bacterium]